VDVVAEQPRQQIKELARDLEHAASIAQAFREDIRLHIGQTDGCLGDP
jgi:hypothetical protein